MVWILLGAFWLQTLDPGVVAQVSTRRLSIVVLECEGAINEVRSGTACEPRIRVEDESGVAVAGATVTFTLPKDGPGGFFPPRETVLVVRTDSSGEAVASGLVPNRIAGPFEIRVEASLEGSTAATSINQINALRITPVAERRPAGKRKMLMILGGVAAAAAAALATLGGGGRQPAQTTPGTIIVPGKPSVGPPP